MQNNNLSFEQALHKGAAYCSRAERCISELRDKLIKWDVSTSYQEKIIEHLVKEKFIDELRFATAYANDKFKYNKWGKIKIRTMLYQKQISKQIIEKAINSIEDDGYKNQLIMLAKAKVKTIKYKDEYEKKAKLYRFLLSKGFEIEFINQVDIQNL